MRTENRCSTGRLATALTVAGTMAAAAAVPASAQDFPTGPITIVVPFAAGASTDAVARLIEPTMSEVLGQPVVVENRGGSGGNVGTAHVARSSADGHTVLLTVYPPITVAPHIYETLPYDPLEDLTPVALLANSVMALAVSSELPVETLEELIEYARENPGTLSFGSAGVGSAHHFAGEMINEAADIDMVHIPYPGGGPALQDLAGGHIEVSFGTLPAVLPHVETGTVRIIALAENERYDAMPEIPAITETFPEIRRASWIGLFVPAGTPDEAVERLSEAALTALEQEDVRQRLNAIGMEVLGGTREELAQLIEEDYERNREIVERLGIEAE